MNIERLLKILRVAKRLEAMAKEAEQELIAYVAAGGSLPGHYVARQRSPKREWVNENHARKVLTERGVNPEVLTETRMKSVAQLERILPRELLEGLWHLPDRGVSVVPDYSGLEEATF